MSNLCVSDWQLSIDISKYLNNSKVFDISQYVFDIKVTSKEDQM